MPLVVLHNDDVGALDSVWARLASAGRSMEPLRLEWHLTAAGRRKMVEMGLTPS